MAIIKRALEGCAQGRPAAKAGEAIRPLANIPMGVCSRQRRPEPKDESIKPNTQKQATGIEQSLCSTWNMAIIKKGFAGCSKGSPSTKVKKAIQTLANKPKEGNSG